MSPRRYDAVLLDAYGTLVELDTPFERLRDALRERLGVEVSLADAERAFRAEMTYYSGHCHEGRDEVTLRELRAVCAGIALRELGLDVDPDRAADALLDALRFRVYDDVEPTLAGLRAAGVPVAVVSNWDHSLPLVLREAGLAFEHVFDSATAGAQKPDPALFRAATRALALPPQRVLHVGDTPEADGAGARAAGVDHRIVDRSGTLDDPCAIGSLTDILPLVA
jgi:putative hydrolase of the HAD superfamily